MSWTEPSWFAEMPLPWYVNSLELRWEARACSWGTREQKEYAIFLTNLVAPHGPALVEIGIDVRVEPPAPRDLFGAHDLLGLSRRMTRPDIALSGRAVARVAVGVRARGGEAWVAAREERDRADERLAAIGAALNRIDVQRGGNVEQTEFEPVFEAIGGWRTYDERPEWWAGAEGMPRATVLVVFPHEFGPNADRARRLFLGAGS